MLIGSVEVGSQMTIKLMNGSVVKADVIKKGPVPVIFVSSYIYFYIILYYIISYYIILYYIILYYIILYYIYFIYLFQVTYDGWSKVYDEYVEIGQCSNAKTGAKISNISEVQSMG